MLPRKRSPSSTGLRRAVTEVPRLGAQRGVAQDGADRPVHRGLGGHRPAAGTGCPAQPHLTLNDSGTTSDGSRACGPSGEEPRLGRLPATRTQSREGRAERAHGGLGHLEGASVAGGRRKGGRGGPSAAAWTAAAESQGSTEQGQRGARRGPTGVGLQRGAPTQLRELPFPSRQRRPAPPRALLGPGPPPRSQGRL